MDQDGVRQDAQLLGADDIQRVNVLTVIASESYETFVRDLQSDIRSTLRERPQKVDIDFFSGKTLEVDGEDVAFSGSDSKAIYKYLLKNDFLDDGDRPSDSFRAMAGEGKFQASAMEGLPEGLNDEAHAKAIETLLRGIYDPHALDGMVQRAQEKVTENAIVEKNFGRVEFKELWERIGRKHSYTVSFDDAELEQKAVARIDRDHAVRRLQYIMTAGAQREEGRREDLADGRSFATERSETHDVDEASAPIAVAYDLVDEVASAAQVTRASAARILSAISPQVFSLYRVTPRSSSSAREGSSSPRRLRWSWSMSSTTRRTTATTLPPSRPACPTTRARPTRRGRICSASCFRTARASAGSPRTWTRPARSWSMPSSLALSRYPTL